MYCRLVGSELEDLFGTRDFHKCIQQRFVAYSFPQPVEPIHFWHNEAIACFMKISIKKHLFAALLGKLEYTNSGFS